MWLSVLNRKQEIEIWLRKKNADSFVLVLVNCLIPNASDKVNFIKQKVNNSRNEK